MEPETLKALIGLNQAKFLSLVKERNQTMEGDPKLFETDYMTFCSKCKYSEKGENDYPCSECLEGDPMKFGTRKPTRFEEKK